MASLDSEVGSRLFEALEDEDLDAVAQMLTKDLVNGHFKPSVALPQGSVAKGLNSLGRGMSPLMVAMRRGSADLTKLLLSKGADINDQDQLGKSAPMYAVEFGHGSLVKEVGAVKDLNLELKDRWGHSLLMYTAVAGNDVLMNALLQRRAVEQELSEQEQEEVYIVSAKYGRAKCVGQLIERYKPEPSAVSPHRALLSMCIHGHWIPRLVKAHLSELNLRDADGKTPLLHSLMEGHDTVVRNLLDFGVDVSVFKKEEALGVHPDEGLAEKSKNVMKVSAANGEEEKRSVLMVALESGSHIELETVEKLVEVGAPTGIPPLINPNYTLEDCILEIQSERNVFGQLISRAMSMRYAEADRAMRLFRLARVCLSTAFYEQPGAALCAAVCIAANLQEFGDRIRLQDVSKSDEFATESQNVGLAVGPLVSTLDESDRERLFRSTGGCHFLRLAAASERKMMLASPAVKVHITKRWMGSLFYAIIDAEGTFRWGDAVLLRGWEHRAYLSAVAAVAVCVNLLLYPLVAIFPPLEQVLKGTLDRMGVDGVDPRLGWREKTEGGVTIEEGGYMASGYSPQLRLWWRALYLIDVPAFKFWVTQACNCLLLLCLLIVAPCVDINNIEPSGCFTDSNWDVLGWFPGDPVAGEHPHPPNGQTTGEAVRRMLFGTASEADGIIGRMLKPRGAARGNNNGGGGDGGYTWEAVPATEEELIHLGVSQEFAYVFIMALLGSQIVSVLRLRVSIATATTYASALASSLGILFFALDHFNLTYPEVVRPEPGLYAAATFLQTLDISRALLLQTPSCGPYVLMLFSMFKDLTIWLWLLTSIVFGFAAAVYINATVEESGDACTHTHSFFGNVYTLFEVTMNGDTQIECNRTHGEYVGQTLMLLYYLVSMILLMNMLIAMMAKTFDKIFDAQEQNYNYVFARVVISVDLDQGAVPAPLSLLRAPYRLISDLSKYGHLVGGFIGRRLRASLYGMLEEDASAARSAVLLRRSTDYKHCSGPERLARLKEIEQSGEVKIEKTHENVEQLVQRIAKIEGIIKPDEDATDVSHHRVKVYASFKEEASRMVFHYGDQFQHLPEGPTMMTILKEGNVENDLQQLPIKPGDDPKDKDNKKLIARALICFPFPQTMDTGLAKSILRSSKYDGHQKNYVYQRDNETYGVLHTWPMKYNDAFQKSFACTTTNVDTTTFHPQAAAEFGETVRRLFGADATTRSPIIFARRVMQNEFKVFVGKPDELERFLRRHPEACDELGIAKLIPGGFIAMYKTGDGGGGFKEFGFQPGVEQAIYTKKGWETMASIKPMHLFDKDCTLGEEITLTWDAKPGEVGAPTARSAAPAPASAYKA